MPARGVRGVARRLKGLAGRLTDYTPALDRIAHRYRINQDEHWQKVQQTPFSEATLRIYSEGRQGFPTPGTFATATGTLRDRMRSGIRVDKDRRTIVIDPLAEGNTHPTAESFQEVYDTQEAIQKQKGAGSLSAPIDAEAMGRNAAIVLKYILGDYGT